MDPLCVYPRAQTAVQIAVVGLTALHHRWERLVVHVLGCVLVQEGRVPGRVVDLIRVTRLALSQGRQRCRHTRQGRRTGTLLIRLVERRRRDRHWGGTFDARPRDRITFEQCAVTAEATTRSRHLGGLLRDRAVMASVRRRRWRISLPREGHAARTHPRWGRRLSSRSREWHAGGRTAIAHTRGCSRLPGKPCGQRRLYLCKRSTPATGAKRHRPAAGTRGSCGRGPPGSAHRRGGSASATPASGRVRSGTCGIGGWWCRPRCSWALPTWGLRRCPWGSRHTTWGRYPLRTRHRRRRCTRRRRWCRSTRRRCCRLRTHGRGRRGWCLRYTRSCCSCCTCGCGCRYSEFTPCHSCRCACARGSRSCHDLTRQRSLHPVVDVVVRAWCQAPGTVNLLRRQVVRHNKPYRMLLLNAGLQNGGGRDARCLQRATREDTFGRVSRVSRVNNISHAIAGRAGVTSRRDSGRRAVGASRSVHRQ